MRIDILTAGSYGDIRPYLALARGLRARGHDARLLGPDSYARFVEPAGVRYQALGPYFDEDETHRVLAAMAAEPNPVRHPALALAISRESTLKMGAALLEHTRTAELLVAHNFVALGPIAAAVHQTPLVTGHLFPLMPCSRYWLRGQDFGALINRLLWRFAARAIASSTDPLYQELLRHFGLPAQRDFLLRSGHSRLSNLIAVSPRVLPRDPDWPAHYELTGYWDLPEPAFTPDRELEAFMRQGEPPVAISFGSMVGIDAARLTELVVQAAARCGRRIVLQAGWAGLGRGVVSRDVFVADFVPHDWLFARAACVVHHGGAGTSAAALRAGKPQIIAHHLGDQQFWSRRVRRLGVSSAGVSHHALSADWLSRALRHTLADAALGRRAAQLGAALRAEDGVAQAVLALERAAERASRVPAARPAVKAPLIGLARGAQSH
jgi:sterol 3beta-glucosyltransferase